jgi:hypothetical protein
MAKSAVPPGAYSSPKDVEQRWVKTKLLEGDVVVEKKLGPKGTPLGVSHIFGLILVGSESVGKWGAMGS